jgi:hypothetical protein
MTHDGLGSIPEPVGPAGGGFTSGSEDGGGDCRAAGKASTSGSVSVAVVAGEAPGLAHQASSSLANLTSGWPESPREEGFLKRAGRRLRLRCGGHDCWAPTGPLFLGFPCSSHFGGLQRRHWCPRSHQVACATCSQRMPAPPPPPRFSLVSVSSRISRCAAASTARPNGRATTGTASSARTRRWQRRRAAARRSVRAAACPPCAAACCPSRGKR